jgi:RNA polymerase sigma-70 factor (ECF subfamily)
MADDARAVIDRARRGDREAFGSLVRRHQRRVYMTALRMTGCHDDAHDVAQEAFVRAYSRLASFDGRSDFFTWLYRIVVNVALNHLRKARRQRTVPLEEVVLPEPLAKQAGNDPRRALELKRLVQKLDAALQEALTPTLRATLVLVIMDGLPYRDAAAILDCSEGTVAWRVHEARQKLREALGQSLVDSVDAQEKQAENKDELSRDAAAALPTRR